MDKYLKYIASSKLMMFLLLLFAVSIALATFIENDFGTQTARAVVYNSWWFSLMLFLGIINILAVIFMKKLYMKEKFSVFVFHLAFVVILLGSAITRFFAVEGSVHIREGETSNVMASDHAYLSLSAFANGQTQTVEKNVGFSAFSDNYYKLKLESVEKKISVECMTIIPNAEQVLVDDPNGIPYVELIASSGEGDRETYLIKNNEFVNILGLNFSLNNENNKNGVNIVASDSSIFIVSAVGASINRMVIHEKDTLKPAQLQPFSLMTLYNFNGLNIVAKSFMPKGRIDVQSKADARGNNMPMALKLKITVDGVAEQIDFFAFPNALNKPLALTVNNVDLKINYGSKILELPFDLTLKDFIIERYPGSNSPSWFESKIFLTDRRNNFASEYRVYMNNVLNYGGYRFYQSSYDTDEGGTILSVNKDFWGTFFTYLGYLLLAIGMVWSLINKNSRFRKISFELNKLRDARKFMGILIFFIFLALGNQETKGQDVLPDSVRIDKGQSSAFGQLLVQDQGGRIKPINSIASEFLRKISRKTSIMGQNSDQVLLGMIVFPEYWQKVPMIRVSHPEVKKILNIEGSFASFQDFLNQTSGKFEYLLEQYVEDAYRKKPAERGKFENEIIKVDERVNLCYLVYSEQLLKIFPKPNDLSHTWYGQNNSTGMFQGNDSLFVRGVLPVYIRAVREACRTNNWNIPSDALFALNNFQQMHGKAVNPDSGKIKAEILYNKIDVFNGLASFYGLVGFVLLLFQFISVFKPKLKTKLIIQISTYLIIVGFVVHLAGLIVRWYISGHAPWSNAYESLIYIAFATVLSGLLFSSKSGIALSVSALIAWLILFVAHLNWMDPEITNLVPVLKSYWLLIHVAIITASYGFLAMGGLMAFVNLCLMGVRNAKNALNITHTLQELTIIIEMSLIIGLYMLTIGTFLGGVWANESWGRYWGWDAKETWALVSVLVYAFVAHMRMVPGLKGLYLFNLMSLLAFSSIIMTYFGVNYYLSGLHSYAKGDPMPVPSFVYYTVAIIGIVAVWAYLKQKKFESGKI
jgi:cytochrome c-type biogenesis protein CcsB